ncbi:MAG: hypothetical protein ABIB98_04045 [bacterium]
MVKKGEKTMMSLEFLTSVTTIPWAVWILFLLAVFFAGILVGRDQERRQFKQHLSEAEETVYGPSGKHVLDIVSEDLEPTAIDLARLYL